MPDPKGAPQAVMLERSAAVRRQLLQRERQASSKLVRAHGQSWRRVVAVLALLAAGKALQSDARVVVERELRVFARVADDAIAASQQGAARQAVITVARQVGGTPIPAPAMARPTMRLALRAALTITAVAAVMRTLSATASKAELVRAVRRPFAAGLARTLTISRTETMNAYREATRQGYLAHADVVSGWIWSASLDERTCDFCTQMDGTFHTLNESLESHQNCRCQMVPVVRGG